MKVISQQKSQQIRKERNAELLRRMQNGEKLSSFSSLDSWYPPRPIAEKDRTAIHQLYGTDVDERLKRAGRGGASKGKGEGSSHDAGFKPLRLA